MKLGTERVEEFIFSQVEEPKETLEGVLPKKRSEVKLRRELGSGGKPTTIFTPSGYPQSLAKID